MAKQRPDRGERWVAAQGMLLLLALAAPQWEGAWPPTLRCVGRLCGYPISLADAILLTTASVQLGHNLTALPKPKEHGTLVQTGVYGLVRHPIYGGITFVLLGGALVTGRLARLAVAFGAIAFFDAKSRQEEQWLAAQFPDYSAYRRRVRKLIPGIY